MDLKRNALIAGLAIVSYFMLLAWNEDYPAQAGQTQAVIEASPNLEGLNTDLPNTAAIETDPNAAGENSDIDLPQVAANGSSAPIVEIATVTQSLINIKTPVHNVSIDLKGGDIVNLSLPKYPTTLETPDDPFVLLKNDRSGVYVAPSGLIGRNGPDASTSGRPLYQTEQSTYSLNDDQQELTVNLSYSDAAGVFITKRFIFNADDYLIKIQYIIDNQSQTSWGANLFGQIKRDGSPDFSSEGGMGMKPYLGGALYTPDDHYKKVDFEDIDDANSNETNSVMGGWIAFSQHYFLSSWIPNSETNNTYTTRKNSANEYIFEFVSPETTVAAGTSEIIDFSFWAGPKDQYRLEEISPYLGLTIDYGWLWFVAQPIFWLLTQIHSLLGNWGWSIIGLTVVIKLLFAKLSAASYRSMAKMRRLAPKIAIIKERYGDDRQKATQEQMALWKKEKVNPLGGCLPMLIQMPFLIGIYWVLGESVELRQAPFILWYNDLSTMDPYFILPLVMGASMFISQSMTPMTTADPMQAKVMKFMPVVFTGIFLFFPSGLVLYWLIGNIFNITQQQYINRQVDKSYETKSN